MNDDLPKSSRCMKCGMTFVIGEPFQGGDFGLCSEGGCMRRFWSEQNKQNDLIRVGMTERDYRYWMQDRELIEAAS